MIQLKESVPRDALDRIVREIAKGRAITKTARNEQKKLTAIYLNNIAAGIALAAIAIPLVVLFTGKPVANVRQAITDNAQYWYGLLSVFWCSLGLHWLAVRSLRSLED